ncbi:MAG: cryptochrome/photolyase family protein [Puniceicoccaceae bacterium]
MTKAKKEIRNLVLVFGDQLDPEAGWREGFDAKADALWMAEASAEANYAWSTKQRIAVFFAAMRHFREARRKEGIKVWYSEVDDGEEETLGEKLNRFLDEHRVGALVMVKPGEYRILAGVRKIAKARGLDLKVLDDTHFLTPTDFFAGWAKGRKELRMEYFYREMRKKEGILLDGKGPEGGKWNYDSDNRRAFGKKGPGNLPRANRFPPDGLTRSVIELVNDRFAGHPGTLDSFAWPVSPEQAKIALGDFLEKRLENFGTYQDAMWTGEAFLYHSLLSVGLNLKLIHPREVIRAAEEAYRKRGAPLAAVEGFIRQILGWREYVREVYWHYMPEYLNRNSLEAEGALPAFYWTGETEMVCMREAIGQTLEHGYAHHIQRLMVTGLFGLLYGVNPREMHQWYLGVYVDAVEWVELPNVLGMSQYGDGGVMASKPYAATGKYIQRMSNYCDSCPYDPRERLGPKACPFTTLYWDFLMRNEGRLRGNQRMGLQLKNLERLEEAEKVQIREQAKDLIKRFGREESPASNSGARNRT